ncbi:phage terminase large subunit family protein [Oryzomonas rubra]|uniref:Phage terminase large subunit GpA ATPase domain-containing protein n=1 Tax=Oryzomonas rubra TaxID=2509454 RepID=A0A5A9X7E7_9BACT|nr:phage terminase large subunit family protein [Oryzomonas rubra]KAA0888714.1 hypothetical protein ET418_15145 [Oryzomonas rubra]
MHYSKTQILMELERRKQEERARAMKLLQERGVTIPQHIVASGRPSIAKDVPNSLYELVEKIRRTLKVDNEPFTWEGHEYLIEPYKAMQVTGDHDLNGLKMVLMCGAQVGKTIFGFLALVWLALRFWGKYFGYFLPDQAMAMIFSDVRFKPTVRSIPEIKPLWGEDPDADPGEKRKTDQKRVRSIGPSQIFFSYMQGATSTESIPMLGVIFDEVRKMMEGDIERAEERISHSPYPINFKYSTAGYPDANIDKYFKQSDQHRFHSRCGCKDGVVLADCFPDCIGQRGKEYVYVCPTCNEIITNPRDGLWIPHNPESKIIGYHIPQTLSCRQTPEKIIRAYEEAQDLQEFFNSKLGIAYLAPESRIVSDDILQATVNPDLKWLTKGTNFAMGVDQMGGFNVVVIRYWGPKTDSGLHKSRLAHIEFVYADDPWERCDELMKQYDISACVVDGLPNINEARRFAQRHRGKVWLADYSYETKGDGDICEWGDRPKQSASEKRSSDEIKNKFTVRISRYHGIEWNLMKYVHRFKEQPNELALEAEIQDTLGKKKMVRMCKDVFWVHLQKVARRKEWIDESQGKFRMIFENIGLDPHCLHSDLYCELALSRVPVDSRNRPFGDLAPSDKKPGEHSWTKQGASQVYICDHCRMAVRANPGQTAQAAADAAGYTACQADWQA